MDEFSIHVYGESSHIPPSQAEAQAMSGKVGRPRISLEVAEAAMRLHEQGMPWHDVEIQLQISRRTILRRIRGTEDRGRNSSGPSGGP